MKKLGIKFSKYLSINKYTINSENDKQLSYRLICSLKLVELKTNKTYIRSNLANSFIWLSNSSVKVFILFVKKVNINFCQNMNY